MNMNWGYKILIVIVLFIITMGGMVYVAMQQNNEMLDDHYYEREQKYQSLIDAQNRLNKVTDEKLLSQNDAQIILQVPTAICGNISQGTMHFIRNDDQSKDKIVPINPDADCKQLLDKKQFSKGMYKVRISWEFENQQYYNEDNFFVKL